MIDYLSPSNQKALLQAFYQSRKMKNKKRATRTTVIRTRSKTEKIKKLSEIEAMDRAIRMKEIMTKSQNPNCMLNSDNKEVTLNPYVFRDRLVYQNGASKVLLTAMFIDSGFLETLNLPLKHWFKSQGWLSVLTLRDKIYPDLVHEFYRTLTKINEGTFMFSIRGEKFFIDDVILGSILGIPFTGKHISRHVHASQIDNYDYYGFVRKIFKIKDDQPITYVLRRSKLDPELETLHYFMTRVIVPIRSNLGTMTSFDIHFIWNVMHYININLSSVMLEHMSTLRMQDDLPYSMILTSVFRHFKINFEKEPTLNYSRCLGKTEVYKMLVRYKDINERVRISREIFCTQPRNPYRFKLFVRQNSSRTSLDDVLISLPQSISSESNMFRTDSPCLSINSLYVNELNLQKRKGIMTDQEADSAIENQELTRDELDLMNSFGDTMEKPPSSSEFVMPNCPVYIDADTYKTAQQETTPLFFTQQNLQSGFLEEVEPSFLYKFTVAQIVNLSGHLRNMFGEVNNTAYNLDSHSKFLASTMAQVDEMSQRMTKQSQNLEGHIANLTAKMDSLCCFVQDRMTKQSLALKELNNKLDDQHGRVFTLHNNQQFLLGRQEDVLVAIRSLERETDELKTAIQSIPGITMVPEPSPPHSD
ncbi:hypothetical protein M5689_020712 [Euphorbia peplus]|nr:hypothetical protein M5689_020712 [Euphorbia peplus]